jgi:peptidoglycan/LPS O-acetylase OafA/YrhL
VLANTVSANSLSWRNPRLAGRIPELDGIRGLAILLVLVWHSVANGVQGVVVGSWQAYSLVTLRLTWTGVDLFFVLSGFLIGGILYDAKNSKSYYRTFYFRRIYRIFPLYFTWIALFMAGLHFTGPNSANTLREIFNRDIPVWPYPLFLQNFSMASQATLGPTWMSVTWSLAVEEQFYLLLPLIVRHLNYRGITILATTSILVAPVVRLILWFSGNVYVGPYTLLPCRMDALGFGVLVALACRNKAAWEWLASRRRHLYFAFLLLGCGVVFMHKYQRHLFTFGLTWIAAFYAVLLLLTVVNPGRLETSCFRSQFLVKLGTLAYAVYIFHQGTNALLHFAIFGGRSNVSNWSSLFVTLLSLVAVMLLAALSWRLLEKPLIRHAHEVYRY